MVKSKLDLINHFRPEAENKQKESQKNKKKNKTKKNIIIKLFPTGKTCY